MLLPFYAFYYSIGFFTSQVTYDVIYCNRWLLDLYKMAISVKQKSNIDFACNPFAKLIVIKGKTNELKHARLWGRSVS